MQKKLDDFFELHRPQPPKPSQSSSRSSQSTVASQCTLRLPIHTRRLWEFSRPMLISLSQNVPTAEIVVNTISQLILECRILKDSEINPTVLTEFLIQNNNPITLSLFSKIAQYALEVEFLFVQPVPISTKYSNSVIHLNSLQIRCLLSLQFLCCFPKQESRFDLPKDYTYARIFNKSHANTDSQKAKIMCALNYFSRIGDFSEYFLTFIRKSLSTRPDWESINSPMTQVHLLSNYDGTEDFRDKLMIDFANKYIGGGTLSSGTVQEEIMFHKHVEPIVSMLFTEKLEDEEALLIKGSQRFNQTSGFKSDFRFQCNLEEALIKDDYGRNDCYIVAIDAEYYQGNELTQFSKERILRELNKAYVGFAGDSDDKFNRDIITGRWGCGAFGGNDHLKFVIQWLAASAVGKEMHFLLWDMKNPEEINQFINVASTFTIGKIFKAITNTPLQHDFLTNVIKRLFSLL